MEPLPFLFFIIALIYSSVGFAGGSSYLLALTMAGISHAESAPIALLCNLIVSSIGIWNFQRAGHLRPEILLPFLLLSVPMAFLGAGIGVSKKVFLLLLGGSLAVAAFRLFLSRIPETPQAAEPARLWRWGLPAGAVMGFFSGVIGIGGGIFLSPFLVLMRLAPIRQASAAASVFIFVNSLSGLAGMMQKGILFPKTLPLLAVAAALGGWIGSRGASRFLPQEGIQKILGVAILYIAANMILKAL
jgi:uncharacterized protein